MRIVLCGLAAIALAGCGHLGRPEPAPGSFCDVAKPFYWSAADTDETIIAAKEHNAVGKRLCGWGS